MLQSLKDIIYNGSATTDGDVLRPPRGVGQPPEGLPVTVAQLRALSGSQLTAVLAYYGLDDQGTDAEKRTRVRREYGVGVIVGPGLIVLSW